MTETMPFWFQVGNLAGARSETNMSGVRRYWVTVQSGQGRLEFEVDGESHDACERELGAFNDGARPPSRVMLVIIRGDQDEDREISKKLAGFQPRI